ncbi:hypothetical protein ElyMa_005304000 [Elysia marginata]|uniref:BESS domain-containing protein n=1 Tax=Elysia marginata TaxID=1093978 RepID=A0AAV4K1C8_9GAST|nr:hypothetical protein ElyMa_005304000 [Elysia marginata]
MEQSGTIDSLGKSNDCSSREEKPKDIDTGVDGNQQSRDGSQDFEVSGGFDQESEDIWKRELPCNLRELFESITKGKDQTVSKMIFDTVQQQLYLQPKRINVHRLQTAVHVAPKCLTFFGSS